MYNHTCRYLYFTVYRHDKRIQMVVVRATNGFGSGVRILTERVVHRNRIFCRGGRFFFLYNYHIETYILPGLNSNCFFFLTKIANFVSLEFQSLYPVIDQKPRDSP